ncbi:hypothetical protein PAPHI01_0400 [Pancytospora philotis]|nr:hypothetical protein PAPHI01_0400 [Pancytospora philotis]
MSYPSLKEAKRYAEELLPTKSSVYSTGSSLYSNFKTAVLKKECAIPPADLGRCGLLPELSMFWYATPCALNLYSYESHRAETISNFSSDIVHVRCFQPAPGVFHGRVAHCLFVATETDAFIYAIDNTLIVGTEFTCRLRSPIACLDICAGNIFMGCQNGRVYQATYGSIELIGYRYMSLCSSESLVSSIVGLIKRKRRPVIGLSAGRSYVVELGASITVYKIWGRLFKEYTLPCTEEYVAVQIVEESPLFFYCVHRNGRRDFFNASKMMSKEFPINFSAYADYESGAEIGRVAGTMPQRTEASLGPNVSFRTTSSAILGYKPGESSHFVLASFNTDQLRNFSRARPVENYETFTLHSGARAVGFYKNELVVLGDKKVSMYEIMSPKRFLLSCRLQDAWAMLKNYGEIEFMVMFFELAAEGEDVGRIEGMCKNDSIVNHALFVYLYGLLRPVFFKPLSELLDDRSAEEMYNEVAWCCSPAEAVISKLKTLQPKIAKQFTEASEFVQEVIQTYNYAMLLHTYNIELKESLAEIVTHGLSDGTALRASSLAPDYDFKAESLKRLLAAVPAGQSIEPLLKIIKNNCPLFLPIEQVNYQRGLDLLSKDSTHFIEQSLECFAGTKFDRAIIRRYNQIGFYYGSVVLIRDKFELSHDEAVALLRESVKCKKAVDAGLVSHSEPFLYPFFEVLLELKEFAPCRCCETQERTVDLLTIDHPMFITFLKDKAARSRRAGELHWKCLLARGKKAEAVEAIIGLCDTELAFDEKVELLEIALTMAAGLGEAPGSSKRGAAAGSDPALYGRVRLMLKLSQIQAEMMERDQTRRSNRLLSADSLYNDYCFEYPDLGIRIFDAVGFGDRNMLRELYVKCFADLPFAQCLAFLRLITNKDLSLVLDILIEKMGELEYDMCGKLLACGFRKSDIVLCVRDAASDAYHPSVKDRLCRSLENFTKAAEFERKTASLSATIL